MAHAVARIWLGWSSVVLGLGLLAARAVWTTPIAFGPYVLYWAWLIAVSIVLVRRVGEVRVTNVRAGL